jgi:CBS domain-containing protein
MRVADVMTKEVACCTSTDPASVPARLMWECDCGSVPVVDPQTRRTVGMITDRDICMATWMQDRPPSAVQVWEVMSRGLHACAADDSIAEAERIMRSEQIRRLPVLDSNDRLIGILSLADIVRASERERTRPRREVAPEEVTSTLGQICQPRNNGKSAESARSV